ncbi:MAG: HNH endonuclease [Clostridiales bacterium]|nr:HNH endonuclease [Clostridiales bacterium]
MKTKITYDRLFELMDYDPNSGVFSWKISRGRARKGDAAGCPDSAGYLLICIDGTLYLAHRLAWLFVNKKWPNMEIDHINRDKTDNRIINLRLATRKENIINKSPSKINSSGTTGVYWNKLSKKWHAQICSNGKRISLGLFESKEMAISARKQAELDYFGVCVA